MMAFTISDIRTLFAYSGNRCAFPDCDKQLIENDNLYVGQICHIEAASINGPRYNPEQSEEERNSFKNLILLCYPHHRRIDSEPELYTVEWLRAAKQKHELVFRKGRFEVSHDVLAAILKETEEYWNRLKLEQYRVSQIHEWPMLINPEATHSEVLEELEESIFQIVDLAKILGSEKEDNPGPNKFEALCIGLPNLSSICRLYIRQLEVQYLSNHLILHPNDANAAKRLEAARAELMNLTSASSHVD